MRADALPVPIRRGRGNLGGMRPLLVMLLVGALAAAEPAPAQAEEIRPPAWAQPLTLPGVPNLHLVAPGVYRGAQPSAAGMRELEKLGIKLVINLRAFNDDEDEVAGTALRRADVSFKTWHAEDEDVARFLKLIADPANQPVYIHCLHGADRTGTMCAIYRMAVQGWSSEAAIREMIHGGFNYHAIWSNLPSYLRRVDPAALRAAAGLPAPAGAP